MTMLIARMAVSAGWSLFLLEAEVPVDAAAAARRCLPEGKAPIGAVGVMEGWHVLGPTFKTPFWGKTCDEYVHWMHDTMPSVTRKIDELARLAPDLFGCRHGFTVLFALAPLLALLELLDMMLNFTAGSPLTT
ncbi:hypothetical protein B0H16DRAFT_1473089 [Mycena metata]|uniref:Uncharacterized protein n=1 Tax=Mycena metata TaxID=1033252 RepID=A0AAD7HM20_9AGAR|nr:hypothetical protein B0H16DRAFT_1473089 [Mycena metata]